ncbi:DUF4397 domain-containing protein [Microbacterium aquimaris]|uniref:DUF4397 domain-containing protein n=1 Tax=Microbacterium aquimaris TaxID=459816 RepID=A0ABU5N2G7_9MICO|nr:DUF4397 domain-containing protein [Microbacterium aquimaris]MDZ8160264.1 DUF4397 domain-containing protein [Microbacterium aquimaris]
MTTHAHHRRPLRTTLAALTAGAAAAAVLLVAPAAGAAEDSVGWLRLGHLSPDTKSVDVEVTALSGGAVEFELEGVGYGDVSPYTELDAGTYTVSMVPSDAAEGTAPAISGTVTIDPESANTVVAFGPSDDLEVTAISDDLSRPSDGSARIRLIQASTQTAEVDVVTSTGVPIARGAKAGDATGYAEVPAGPWTLELDGGTVTGETSIDVAEGSVSTLFVLDTASGGLEIMTVTDSAAVGAVPEGGVDTGAGGLADADRVSPAPGVPAGAWLFGI